MSVDNLKIVPTKICQSFNDLVLFRLPDLTVKISTYTFFKLQIALDLRTRAIFPSLKKLLELIKTKFEIMLLPVHNAFETSNRNGLSFSWLSCIICFLAIFRILRLESENS